MIVLESLKKENFQEAINSSLKFSFKDEKYFLVPTGQWIYHYDFLINKLMQLRYKSNKFFKTKINQSTKDTRKYLENRIQGNTSILFIILKVNYNAHFVMGFCGLKNIIYKGDVELDMILKDNKFTAKGLMFAAISELIVFTKKEIEAGSIYLKVKPCNIRALKLYDRLGFKVKKSSKILLKVCHNQNFLITLQKRL